MAASAVSSTPARAPGRPPPQHQATVSIGRVPNAHVSCGGTERHAPAKRIERRSSERGRCVALLPLFSTQRSQPAPAAQLTAAALTKVHLNRQTHTHGGVDCYGLASQPTVPSHARTRPLPLAPLHDRPHVEHTTHRLPRTCSPATTLGAVQGRQAVQIISLSLVCMSCQRVRDGEWFWVHVPVQARRGAHDDG